MSERESCSAVRVTWKGNDWDFPMFIGYTPPGGVCDEMGSEYTARNCDRPADLVVYKDHPVCRRCWDDMNEPEGDNRWTV